VLRGQQSKIYVLAKGSEPLTSDSEVIGIKGNVRDGESSCTIRNCGSFEKPLTGLKNLDGCVRNNRGRRVRYRYLSLMSSFRPIVRTR